MNIDSNAVQLKKVPVDVERRISLNVEASDDGFDITSQGMVTFGKPELYMKVREGIFLAGACRILNDCARYMVSRNKDMSDGQRVQLGPWTVVEFNKDQVEVDDRILDVIAVSDGTEMEYMS